MRVTAERQGRPDRSNAGAARNIDALRPTRRSSDNPRRGYPDRSRTGQARDFDRRVETFNRLQAQLRFTEAGADMTTAVDAAAQITLLELDSVAAGKGASLIGVQDSAGDFTAVNVETVLAELNTAATATVDHGSTTGRSDDDHTQYILVAGTRAFTGHVTLNDDVLLKLGTGGDSTITYDGTNTTWDPKAVGSGYLRVNSKIGVNAAPSEEVHAADTVRADTFFNHNGTDGLTSDVSFSDGAGSTQSVTVRGGLITAWGTGGGGGGGGGGG